MKRKERATNYALQAQQCKILLAEFEEAYAMASHKI
jgi:hypothetical protein